MENMPATASETNYCTNMDLNLEKKYNILSQKNIYSGPGKI
jgi:hypothetical protein